jgi:HEAT repeat protein
VKSTIRVFVFAAATVAAFGQLTPPPPRPARPPAGPAPVAAPAPIADVAPVLTPAPPMEPRDLDFDFDFDFDFDIDRVIKGVPGGIKGGVIGGIPGGVIANVPGGMDKLRFEIDRARQEMDRVRDDLDTVKAEKFKLIEKGFADMNFERMNDAFLMAQASTPKPAAAPMPPGVYVGTMGTFRRGSSEERVYQRGAEYMDKREWDKAIDAFDQVIENKGNKADGAFYWKAYAQAKAAQSDKALATLSELQKSYPNSRWLNDAKALEAEVRQNRGQAVSPEQESDDDLKLLAISSIANNDPDRAVPLLQKILQSRNSPKVKERALFVLAQTQTPQARDVVIQFAKGSGNPDMQTKAVEYLGVYGGKQNMQVLSEIYSGSNDPSLRRSILQSFMRAGDKDRLLSAARNEQNQELRTDAIRLLGHMGAQAELAQMYTAETAPEAKAAIIDAMFSAENSDKLVEIARSEKDAKLRAQAIQRLGNLRRGKTAEPLVALYSGEADRSIKEQIMRSLYHQGSAKEVVDIARKENDPELRRAAVRYLSNMKSKEATDYLVELLNK